MKRLPLMLMILMGPLTIGVPGASASGVQFCPLSQGYWKNHISKWKLSSMTLGTAS